VDLAAPFQQHGPFSLTVECWLGFLAVGVESVLRYVLFPAPINLFELTIADDIVVS
jgi:hypothetical protein